MNHPPLPPIDQPAQLARLRQFLGWMLPFNFGFAAVEGAASLVFRDAATGITAGVILCYGAILVLAQALVHRGQLKAAVTAIAAGFLVADILIALLQPALFPALVAVPLLAVAVALPYVDGGALRRLIAACWLATATVAMLGEFVPPLTATPSWFTTVFRSSTLVTVIGLVLLLLWQFSSRLNDTLAQMQVAQERYALAAQGANDGLWDWDLVTNEIYLSPRWKAMLGWSEGEIGANPEEWFKRIHPEDRDRVKAEIAIHQDGLTPHFESEHRVRCGDGRYLWVLTRGIVVRDAEGAATRMAGSQTDITRRKQIEEQLLHDAFHDSLTGLPNRALLMERLGRAFTRARRDQHYRFAVLFLDLDRFKVINDSLGHPVGDDLLIALVRRLEACVREGDTFARLGGDEFTILLDNIHDTGDAIQVADRLQAELTLPFSVHGHEIFTSASIGIAVSSPQYHRPEEIVRDADSALYRAKALGKACHALFDPTMHEGAMALLQLENDLRRAVERQEFLVHYQPIVSLSSGKITGFEALVRWQHPQRGIVLPSEFIPVAEETGLIVPIGTFVLHEAVRQMGVWQAQFLASPPLTISVNVSGKQFAQPDLLERVRAVLQGNELKPCQLRLEITESVMMENGELATKLLSQLRALNVCVQIDDFGTSYSSLGRLQQFQIDALKIDRSFVSRLGPAGENTEIVEAIVKLAHALGMDVVAEGVETLAHLSYLQALGCTYGQGWLFSKPVDADVAAGLLAAQRCTSTVVQEAAEYGEPTLVG